MGSLMAGWASDQIARKDFARQRSFTKSEIEAFWQARQQQQQREGEETQALAAVAHLETLGQDGGADATEGGQVQAKARESVARVQDGPWGAGDPDDLSDEDRAKQVKDWWRKSSWAFLNAPPEVDSHDLRRSNYRPQYDLAARAAEALDSPRITPSLGILT